MSDPLDLDALELRLNTEDFTTDPRDEEALYALIAELRACRAERDQALLAATIQGASAREQYDRAERAEAELRRTAADALVIDRELMELSATIARVEALCDGWSDPGRGYVSVAGVRAALRGDPVP